MTENLVDAFPDGPVPADVAEELESLDGVEQCVPVRGEYHGEKTAYQLLVNLTGRGLFGLHYDGSAWTVVYQSADEDPDAVDSDEDLYRNAHDVLFAHAEDDPDSNHYASTPPFWTAPEEESESEV